MSFKSIKDMALGTRQYHNWRLRDLTEEQTLSAKHSIVEGVELFEKAFSLLESGDREGAVAHLKKIAALAEKTVATVEG